MAPMAAPNTDPSSSNAPTSTTAGGAAATTANAGAASSSSRPTASGDPPVPAHAVALQLLDVPLKPSSAILTALSGEFTAAGESEFLVAKPGGTLEVYRIVQQQPSNDDEEDDSPTVRLKLVSRVATRSILRSLAKLRYPGEKRDVVVVGSDSGALSILDLQQAAGRTASGNNNNSHNSNASWSCRTIHCMDYGKTHCRRATPGQYVVTDPRGRAVAVLALEKRKLVYVLNRNAQGEPTLASPLEAHKARTLTYAATGMDQGYDNPVFCTLEVQYPDTDDEQDERLRDPQSQANNMNSTLCPKQVAYYELDLGLNHVSRKWATVTQQAACCVAAVPGGADGPGGVLVGGADWIVYHHSNLRRPIACAVPRRQLHPPHASVLITTLTVHKQKKQKFFAVAQSELGDVYKVTLQLDPNAMDEAGGGGAASQNPVQSMHVALLDTLPPATALCVSRLGMLWAAAEFGDHYLYQFERIDLPDAPTATSQQTLRAFEHRANQSLDFTAWLNVVAHARTVAPTFTPTTLRNLRKIVTLESLAPATGILIGELAGQEVSPQLYTLTGRGPTSALRILRHGASVTELAVSDLPGIPGGIFTVADNTAGGDAGSSGYRRDRFIVVSFADATLVLSVGETVEEVGKESGFLTNSPTLACSALGKDGALCQVHPAGVRHIQRGNAKQWHCPGLKRIECASANTSQVIIALAGGEVIYFELDPLNGNLMEAATRDLQADVCCLDVGSIATGKSRSFFTAVGCRDQTIRILSLEPGNLLVQKSSTALKSRPHSVALLVQPPSNEGGGATGTEELTLMIGLDDGSCLRTTVDPVTGAMGTNPTRRFLGARPVAVSKISLQEQPSTLLFSSRPWIGRHQEDGKKKHVMAPLSYVPLDHGCSFRSDLVREGIVATAGKTLRILAIDSTAMEAGEDEAFNANKVDLRYTPRQMTLLSTSSTDPAAANKRKVILAVVESDYNEYGHAEKIAMGFDATGEGKLSKSKPKGGDDMDMDSDDEEQQAGGNNEEEDDEEEREARRTVIRGPIPPGPGYWGSCVRIMDPANNCATLDCIELEKNEAALCCASVRFHSKGGEPLLAVGSVTRMTMHPLKQAASHVLIYRIVNGEKLQLLHRTTVDDGPILALAHFQGRLLVGIGKSLRLYEMGKRQLLRKSEVRGLPTFVKTLQTVGDRAYVGDMIQSVHIVRYDVTSNRMVLIANDPCPRPIVCQELLDWNTVAVGDKFGNISILRLPRRADTSAVDISGSRALWDSTRSDLTPKLELLCQYYVGEVVTSMTRSALVPAGAESLVYVTVSGRIGALVPFTSRDDVAFYTQLESSLRKEAPRPTGRDPRAYRSYYAPVMHVVDGELCDAFNSLSTAQQSKIAELLDRSVGEIKKKLEDTRNALL